MHLRPFRFEELKRNTNNNQNNLSSNKYGLNVALTAIAIQS